MHVVERKFRDWWAARHIQGVRGARGPTPSNCSLLLAAACCCLLLPAVASAAAVAAATATATATTMIKTTNNQVVLTSHPRKAVGSARFSDLLKSAPSFFLAL